MTAIRGDAKIYYKPSRDVWAFTLDLGYLPNGKRDRKEYTSKSKTKLIDKKREVIRAVQDGTYRSGSMPTVEAWFTYWLDKICKPRVVPRTWIYYRSHGNVHIIPHIGKRRLDKLTPEDIEFLHEEMRKTVSPSMVRSVHSTLSRCLKDAVRRRVIPLNPCDQMDSPQALNKGGESFTMAETKALLKAARDEGPGGYSRWLMALILGPRQGERLGLEWTRLFLDDGLVDISWQAQSLPWSHGDDCQCDDGVLERDCPERRHDVPAHIEYRPIHLTRCWTRTKTKSGQRLTPIPGILVDALREWREVAPPNDHGLVWAEDGRPYDPNHDRDEWRDLCHRAGVRLLTQHSARHTMATLLLESGVSPEVIRQIMGHSTVLSTRAYMHVSTDEARRALESFTLADE